MGEKNEKTSFWATLPGCLTGIAAMITAIATCIGALYTVGMISPIATPTPVSVASIENYPQNLTPIPTLYSTPIINNNEDPKNWLPTAEDIADDYNIQEQSIVTNEDVAKGFDEPSQAFIKLGEWGRINGYYVYYGNSKGCELKSGYQGFSLNAALFKSTSGAEQALDWYGLEEKKDKTFIYQNVSSTVGDKTYITWFEFNDDCDSSNVVRRIFIMFQKYNAAGTVAMDVIKGTVSDDELLDQATHFAKLIELKIVAAANR